MAGESVGGKRGQYCNNNAAVIRLHSRKRWGASSAPAREHKRIRRRHAETVQVPEDASGERAQLGIAVAGGFSAVAPDRTVALSALCVSCDECDDDASQTHSIPRVCLLLLLLLIVIRLLVVRAGDE